ncbi:MAG: hypothetical protein SW833_10785 [Cyanobacteriota bacterium]|nr:hypothetical protein [Cyanobacteriota bacterium]
MKIRLTFSSSSFLNDIAIAPPPQQHVTMFKGIAIALPNLPANRHNRRYTKKFVRIAKELQ